MGMPWMFLSFFLSPLNMLAFSTSPQPASDGSQNVHLPSEKRKFQLEVQLGSRRKDLANGSQHAGELSRDVCLHLLRNLDLQPYELIFFICERNFESHA